MNILAELHYIIGSHQRKLGNYNAKTLEHLKLAHSLSNKTSYLLKYSRLTRDIEGVVPSELLKQLEKALTKNITDNQLKSITALLQEASETNNLGSLSNTPKKTTFTLDDFYQQQDTWRTELCEYLRTKSIAVIGNSASINNTGYGNEIDSHDVICRFNRYPSTHTNNHSDIGKKTDIWITSAEVLNEEHKPPSQLKWIILTGADARYTLLNKSGCLKYLQEGIQVVTLPIQTWSSLVRTLKSPPSAGLLWLTYLAKEAHLQKTIQVFGFDSAQGNPKQYHISSTKYLPSRRHAWLLEKESLNNLELSGSIQTTTPKAYAVFTRGLANNANLKKQLGSNNIVFSPQKSGRIDYVAGWGKKINTKQAKAYALKNDISYISLEDGFIHSMSQGRLGAKSWSLVIDTTGIFYDATQTSDLEYLINTTTLTADQYTRAQSCISTITKHNITKYNNAPLTAPSSLKQYKKPVLVLDQVEGDMSIPYAMASQASFQDMLDAALTENPDSDILIKRHPDVINGKRKGCITLPQQPPSNVYLITDNINPLVLMKHVDKVYVVSSQAGFEALMLGKEVICFGAPFYSSWGLTSDRFDNNLPVVSRRSCKPDIETIFFAAYIGYSRYLDPIENRPCEIESVLDHVKRQYEHYNQNTGQFICIGLTPWKKRFIKRYLKGPDSEVHLIKSLEGAKKHNINEKTNLLIWSNKHETIATELSRKTGAKVVRIEDGFLRSVNLGSNYTLPSSLVFDKKGIYFDPSKPSGLEVILNNTKCTLADKKRAQLLREKIISLGISKYNLGNQNLESLPEAANGKKVILVPGQVADDASIKLGCVGIKTNLGLLEAVKRSNPDAHIIYKPHPDVVSDNRAGELSKVETLKYCDQVIEDQNITTCLSFVDEVHTLTSLVGFEALMRNLTVHCYGIPFYSNWGLTHDKHQLERRNRKLTIDELTAGTLIHYPRYFDWTTNSFITPENVVDKLYIQSRELTNKKQQSIQTQKLSGYLNLFRALFTSYTK